MLGRGLASSPTFRLADASQSSVYGWPLYPADRIVARASRSISGAYLPLVRFCLPLVRFCLADGRFPAWAAHLSSV